MGILGWSFALTAALRASHAHRLEREARRDNRHNNVQTSTEVDGNRRRSISGAATTSVSFTKKLIQCGLLRCNDRAQNTHDAVEPDRDAVAGAAVGRWHDLGGVGVECAVVDVLSESASSPKVVRTCTGDERSPDADPRSRRGYRRCYRGFASADNDS